MKNAIVLATCLLITVVYAADPEQVRKVRSTLAECAKTFPKCGNDPKDSLMCLDAWICTLGKFDAIDKNGAMVDKKAIEFCNNLISDSNNVAHCEKVANGCFEKGNQSSGSDNEKTRVKLECAIEAGLPNLIDEPK
ncbi:venom allergen 2 [Monomorium pharaonis]|uniref:venom allergen 2 n=1 Tax=Monomorium pharaonis TaxID=307658 RepID=UPI00063FCF9D|nr:venom allergen 2 [Monomorium pharaonis]XP_036149153.1 venom allergen 2 [Monomorium pharaonis]